MFIFDHHDGAMRGIAETLQLLDQQRYEDERLMNDLKLRAQELNSFVPTRALSKDVADRIEGLPRQLNYSLREARAGLDQAERVLSELLNVVLGLDLRHESR